MKYSLGNSYDMTMDVIDNPLAFGKHYNREIIFLGLVVSVYYTYINLWILAPSSKSYYRKLLEANLW